MNEYNSGRSTLYKWIKTKDKLYRQINIHDNKRRNIRTAVNVDIDIDIYDICIYTDIYMVQA